MIGRGLFVLAVGAAAVGPAGCVRRTMKITTEPTGALVYLNDQELGRSEVNIDFLWYGDYDVVIRKEGFETLKTNWVVKRPWYQYIPIDFFAEVLWPGKIVDARHRHFEMTPLQLPTPEELTQRAIETRENAVVAPEP